MHGRPRLGDRHVVRHVRAAARNGVTSIVYEGGFGAERGTESCRLQGDRLVHRADGDPHADEGRRRAPEAVRPSVAALHRQSSASRSTRRRVWWGKACSACRFHDNWWQTETGAIMIANYPGVRHQAGIMGRPCLGIDAQGHVDDDGNVGRRGARSEGELALQPGWPSMFRTYWNKRTIPQVPSRTAGTSPATASRVDADGYFWFVGRADDVINTAGHLVGPFEVESALIEHPAVAEAGVIGKPDPVAMEIVKAFVTLKDGYDRRDELAAASCSATPASGWAPASRRGRSSSSTRCRKTRSGKIMRRLLKARELGLPEGDTSTVEDAQSRRTDEVSL